MKPRMEAETVFGEGSSLPASVKSIGATVVRSARMITSNERRADSTQQRLEVSRQAKQRTVAFTRSLRQEFGEHLNGEGLLFRPTNLPYDMTLEAIKEDTDRQAVTSMNIRVVSPTGRATQFYVSNAEMPNNPHPTLGAQVRIASVAPAPQQRDVFEGQDYRPDDEMAMCDDVIHIMDDFERACQAGEMEIYRLETERTRGQIFA